MQYRESAPPPAQRPWIACYWTFASPVDLEHVVVPDGTVSLVCVGARFVALVGPRITCLRVPVVAGRLYNGLRVQPGAAGPLLGIDVERYRDYSGPLAVAAPRAAAQILTAGLEHAADAWCASAQAPDDMVASAVARLLESHGAARTPDLSRAVGLSERQFQRRFRRGVGLTPKEFARMRRLRQACVQALAGRDSWAAVSSDTGFADQAHLAREFHEVFGWPPRLVQEYLRRIEHRLE